MFCNICKRIGIHSPQCPNYVPKKVSHYCSICDAGIQNGESYIVNDSGKYAHWECFNMLGSWDLLNFLEFTIQEMEDD